MTYGILLFTFLFWASGLCCKNEPTNDDLSEPSFWFIGHIRYAMGLPCRIARRCEPAPAILACVFALAILQLTLIKYATVLNEHSGVKAGSSWQHADRGSARGVGSIDPSKWYSRVEPIDSISHMQHKRIDTCLKARDAILCPSQAVLVTTLASLAEKMSRLEKCLNFWHLDIFWAMWLTPLATWGSRQDLFLESLFIHHPGACLIIVIIGSDDTRSAYQHIFSAIRNLGYCISVLNIRSNEAGLQHLGHKPMPTQPEDVFVNSHICMYVRSHLLHTYGGTYVDTGTIFVQPIPSEIIEFYSMSQSYQTFNKRTLDGTHRSASTAGVIRTLACNPAFSSVAVKAAFVNAHHDPTYDDCGGFGGFNVHTATHFPERYLYPISRTRASSLLQANTPTASLLIKHLQRFSYALHIFGPAQDAQTAGVKSVVDTLMTRQRLTSGGKSHLSPNLPCRTEMGAAMFELMAPRIAVLRGNSTRFTGPHAIFARETARGHTISSPMDFWVWISASLGMIQASGSRASASRSVQVIEAASLRAVNERLAQCIYHVPESAATDLVTITFCARPTRLRAFARSGHIPLAVCEREGWTSSFKTAVFHRLVTVITHTHGRPERVVGLHASVQEWFPGTPVIASEDTNAFLPATTASLRWLSLPVDSGLSYARNEMLRAAETPFVQLLDDDFVLDERSHLDVLLECLLAHEGVAVASPVIPADIQRGWRFQGLIKATHVLELTQGHLGYIDGCHHVEYVPNVFMARRNILMGVDGGLWDPRLKLGEHEEFFWRLKTRGVVIVSCAFVGVKHNQFQWWTPEAMNESHTPRETLYIKHRSRIVKYYAMALTKHGFEGLVINGQTVFEQGDD